MNDPFYGLPPNDEEASGSPTATIVLIAGLVLAALGFVLVGVGFALGWFGPGAKTEVETRDAIAQAEADDEGADAAGPLEDIPTLHGAELMPIAEDRPEPKGFEVADALAGAEPVPEIPPPGGSSGGGSGDRGASGSADGGGAGSGGAAKSGGPRVSVSFSLGHYEHVELELGGRVFALDADRTIKLRPGGYRIQLRKSADAPWKPAGLLTIEAGKRYRVTLFDPPLAKLEVVP